MIKELILASKVKVQTGGGIRAIRDVAELLDAGVDRVVLGSVAITDPVTSTKIMKEFGGNRITLALDLQVQSNGGS